MFEIDRDVPWVVAEGLPSAVALALDDVRRDWRRIFATHPRIEGLGAEGQGADGGLAPGVLVALGSEAVARLTGPFAELADEQHVLEVRERLDGQGLVVCAYGAGTRGEIYALYAFSREVLGVDPFWFWTDQEMEPRETLTVSADLRVAPPVPSFRWRGWFCNDEDLLTAWAPSHMASHGISLHAWDMVFETLLRTGGNFVVPGTFVFPHEPQIARAAERGLAIGQHHIEVLGLNTYRWPDEIPYSFATHPEVLEAAWRESVAAYGDLEVVWSVGYRGRHDRPFWYDDDSTGADDASRGELISAAIRAQVDAVREVRPDDTILLNLWMEGVELWRAGHVDVPADVTVVWPDDGHGQILDGGTISAGQGVYYHTAMHDRIASQVSEMVDVGLITSELRRAAAAEATTHLLVNVSDVRPVVMTTAAAMELAWDISSDTSDFYERWAAQQVGAERAAELAALWRRYFEAPWHYAEGYPDRLEDNAYQTYARALLTDLAAGRFDEDFVFTDFLAHIPRAFTLMGEPSVLELARLLGEGTTLAQVRLDALDADARAFTAQLEGATREFVTGHLVTQVAVHRASNAMLTAVCDAVAAAAQDDVDAALEHLAAARSRAIEVLRAFRAGERGRWNDWYRGDVFLAVETTMQMIDEVVALLRAGAHGSGATILDPQLPLRQYQVIKRYQEGQLSGPRAWVEGLQR